MSSLEHPVPPAPGGAPVPAYYRPSTNGMAVASMVLGILGMVGMIWIISPVLALVFGYVSKGQIDRSGGAQEGRGYAIAGIVLGWVGIAWSLLMAVWMWWFFSQFFEAFDGFPGQFPSPFPSITPIPAPQ
jgi:hypothetical protein